MGLSWIGKVAFWHLTQGQFDKNADEHMEPKTAEKNKNITNLRHLELGLFFAIIDVLLAVCEGALERGKNYLLVVQRYKNKNA